MLRQIDFTHFALKRSLSLPSATLRFLSGLGIVHVNGHTLDPQIQFLWQTGLRASGIHLTSLSDTPVEQVREAYAKLSALILSHRPKGLKIETIETGFGQVHGYDGDIPAMGGTLIRPQNSDPSLPLLVFFHQGLGLLGPCDLSLALCAQMAFTLQCPIFLPNYQLSPEHRYPAGLNDARTAYDFAVANAQKLGAVSGEVAIGGEALGANFALRICLDLKREFKPQPVAQWLISPLIDLSDAELKHSPFADVWPLTSADIDVAIKAYAGSALDLKDAGLSPLLDTSLSGLAKCLIVSGGLDPLAHQALHLVARLKKAHIGFTYRQYDDLPLGFGLLCGLSDKADEAAFDMAKEWVTLLSRTYS